MAGKGPCTNDLDRSRGSFLSEIHACCDNHGLPVGFILTGGEAANYAAAEALIDVRAAQPGRCRRTRLMMTIAYGKPCRSSPSEVLSVRLIVVIR